MGGVLFSSWHFGEEVPNSRFPNFLSCRMGTEFAPPRWAQLRAASRWRRVGTIVFLVRWIQADTRGCAGGEMQHGTRRYVRSYGTAKPLPETDGLHLGFLKASLDRLHPKVNIQVSLLDGRMQSSLHPEVRCSDVEAGRKERFPPPMDPGPSVRLRWG